MIEEIVIQYLSDQMDVPVYAERPETPDNEYLIVERTGGGVENRIRQATITVQSYSTSLFGAASLNHAVENVMQDLTDIRNISRCELNSSYNFTDTETRQYRYQAVFDLVYMEGE